MQTYSFRKRENRFRLSTNFFKGFGSVLNLGGSAYNSPIYSRTKGIETDSQAIASSFEAVGKELYKAMNAVQQSAK